ncbi:MAG TPA: homoserine kinase [Kofleriaceae bacterium]
MGVFTQLGRSELCEVVESFDLGELIGFQAIEAGTINSNFRLDTERGRYFLRVNEGKAEVDVAWEARLVAALASGGVRTPPPVLARDERPYAPLAHTRKWLSVFPWRPGKHLAPSAVTAGYADELGAQLARLHQVGLELPASMRRGSIYDHDHLVSRFERIELTIDPALAQATKILSEELAYVGAHAAVRRKATQGIIHGDLFRDNVLWDDGAVAAILDFEQASGGSLAYDLAVCINDWCWVDGPRMDLVGALLTGYRRVRDLPAADRTALPIEVRAAAARFTITRITDVYLARVANPEKDFRAFLARSEAWRGGVLGQLSSLL